MRILAIGHRPLVDPILVAHLIYSTGLATGSKYCSRRLRGTFIGECVRDTSRTIAIKTHQFSKLFKRGQRFQKAVLIIRNPLNTILAEFHRQEGGKVKNVERDVFTSESKSDCLVTVNSEISREFYFRDYR